LDGVDLSGGERCAFRGHAVRVGGWGGDALEEETTAIGEERAGFASFLHEGDAVEAETGFCFECAVAGEAAGSEGGADVREEVGAGDAGGEEEAEEGAAEGGHRVHHTVAAGRI
jgi:hypothetical protein